MRQQSEHLRMTQCIVSYSVETRFIASFVYVKTNYLTE